MPLEFALSVFTGFRNTSVLHYIFCLAVVSDTEYFVAIARYTNQSLLLQLV